MLRRSLFWFALILSGAALAGGCKSIVGTGDGRLEGEYALQQRAKAHAHYAAGVIHDLHGEPVLALQEYYQAVKFDPDNESLVLEVSRRFLLNKQPDKALEILAHAVNQKNASGELYARLGLVYSQLGKTNLALRADETAIKRSPRLLEGYQNLFLLHVQARQPDAALVTLDEAARVPDTDVEFLTGLGEIYVNFGVLTPAKRSVANAKAKAVFIRALNLHPDGLESRLRLADGFLAINDMDQVAGIYSELMPELAGSAALQATVRARLANIYLKKGDQKLAYDQLEAIIQDDPANPQVYYYLGSLAFDQKQMQKASDYFSKTILLKPDFAPAYLDYASAQLNLGQATNALAMLEKARELFPQNFMLEYLTGVARGAQKDYPGALTNFTTAEILASANDPQRLTGGFYFEIGAACERIGKIAEAEKYFLKCLDLQPDNDQAMNYLGYMWADHGMKLERARELIEKALKAEPDNEAYLDSMGWVLYKLGQPQQALGYILKAVAGSEGPDAELQNHLGDVYSALHQMDKALEAWKKSIASVPDDAVKKKIDAAEKK